jgi:hypothetical protein
MLLLALSSSIICWVYGRPYILSLTYTWKNILQQVLVCCKRQNVHPLHIFYYRRFIIRITASHEKYIAHYSRSCLALQGEEFKLYIELNRIEYIYIIFIYMIWEKKEGIWHTCKAAWCLLRGESTSLSVTFTSLNASPRKQIMLAENHPCTLTKRFSTYWQVQCLSLLNFLSN